MSSRKCRRPKRGERNFLPQTFQVPDRHGGLPFNYFRPGNGAKPVPFGRGHQTPGSAIYNAWKALIAGQPVKALPDRAPIERTRNGTWDFVIELYIASDAFTGLTDQTANLRSIKIIREVMKFGRVMVAETDPDEIRTFIETIKTNDTPEKKKASGIPYGGYGCAKNLRNVWSLLYQMAIRKKLATANPIRDIERPKGDNPDGHADWPEDWIAQYKHAHPKGSLPRAALDIGLETGMRVSDIALAGPAWIEADDNGDPLLSFIPRKTAKHGEQARCFVPLSNELQDTIAATKVVGRNSWLVAEQGGSFTARYLSECFGKWIKAAGLPDEAVAHGLRKSFVRRMIDRGVTVDDVAAMSGHQDRKLVLFYARKRNRRLGAVRGRDAINMAA
jgi:site-specific recombinase XerD